MSPSPHGQATRPYSVCVGRLLDESPPSLASGTALKLDRWNTLHSGIQRKRLVSVQANAFPAVRVPAPSLKRESCNGMSGIYRVGESIAPRALSSVGSIIERTTDITPIGQRAANEGIGMTERPFAEI